MTSPSAEKKAKAKPQSRKRFRESLDDLYHELEGTEASAVSAGASGSLAQGWNAQNQFWSRAHR